MITRKSAGAIIFYMKDEKPMYLLLKYRNYWGYVRGLVEKNETTEEVVKRESKEEANVSELKFNPGFSHSIVYFYKQEGQLIRKEVIYLLAEISEEEAKKVKISWEHEAFKLVSFEDAMKLMKHKNEKEGLEKANALILRRLKEGLDKFLKK